MVSTPVTQERAQGCSQINLTLNKRQDKPSWHIQTDKIRAASPLPRGTQQSPPPCQAPHGGATAPTTSSLPSPSPSPTSQVCSPSSQQRGAAPPSSCRVPGLLGFHGALTKAPSLRRDTFDVLMPLGEQQPGEQSPPDPSTQQPGLTWSGAEGGICP